MSAAMNHTEPDFPGAPYVAQFDDGLLWFFVTPEGRVSSGYTCQASCQHMADECYSRDISTRTSHAALAR